MITTARYVLALDQGTTSSRAMLFDRHGRTIATQNRELRQFYPQPGWVEHDPIELWDSQLDVARRVMQEAGAGADELATIGMTNQRETVVVWDQVSGEPRHRAIVWQDRRTAERCAQLRRAGHEARVREKTGLPIDPYFSAPKIQWLLENVEGLREQAETGDALVGTVDAWLVWMLTGGRIHVTDCSNAARTLIFNIHTLAWDDALLDAFDIPRATLPQVCASGEIQGYTDPKWFGTEIPIAGVAGDQQAALFGQACFEPGLAKNTYGTGCFALMNTGSEAISSHRVVTTVAWSRNGRVEYALEASIFVAGAAVQWLRDELQIIEQAADTEALARSIEHTDGVYLVPAFVGLGAPYWDPHARGAIVGLTRGAGRAHLVRAALEAIAYQTRDALEAMEADSGVQLQALRVDGGAVANEFLMQFQADVLGIPVDRSAAPETTALGAAFLAGLTVGFWRDRDELTQLWNRDRRYEPIMGEAERNRRYAGWRRAVERAQGWAATDDPLGHRIGNVD